MSARKKATVSLWAADYERQHKEDMALLFSCVINQPDIEQMRQQLNVSVHDIEKRQKDFEQVISSFNASVADLEYQTSVHINQQQNDLYQAMEDIAGNFIDESTIYLQQEMDRFQERVDHENQIKQDEINHLRSEVMNERGNKHYILEETISYQRMCRVMQDFIVRNYDVNRFAEKQYQEIANRINETEVLLDKQVFEAAFLSAFQAYQRISELRIELEKQQYQWSILRKRVIHATRQLISIGKENRIIQPVDTDWKIMTDSPGCNLNYWTEGAFQQWMEKVKQIKQIIGTDSPMVSISDLEYYLNEKLPELKKEFEELMKSARIKILNSQIRVNIATIISWALSEQGYVKQKSEYVDCDERLGFEVIVTNHENNQVIIHIDPDTNQRQSILEIETQAANPVTEHEIHRKNYEIMQSLSKYGLNVGEIMALPVRSAPHDDKSPLSLTKKPFEKKVIPYKNYRYEQN